MQLSRIQGFHKISQVFTRIQGFYIFFPIITGVSQDFTRKNIQNDNTRSLRLRDCEHGRHVEVEKGKRQAVTRAYRTFEIILLDSLTGQFFRKCWVFQQANTLTLLEFPYKVLVGQYKMFFGSTRMVLFLQGKYLFFRRCFFLAGRHVDVTLSILLNIFLSDFDLTRGHCFTKITI